MKQNQIDTVDEATKLLRLRTPRTYQNIREPKREVGKTKVQGRVPLFPIRCDMLN